jgi:hypothetical protein
VLSGEIKDPLVGRDILIGCAAAVVINCLRQLTEVTPPLLGYADTVPRIFAVFNALDHPLGLVLSAEPQWAVGDSIAALFLFFCFSP